MDDMRGCWRYPRGCREPISCCLWGGYANMQGLMGPEICIAFLSWRGVVWYARPCCLLWDFVSCAAAQRKRVSG